MTYGLSFAATPVDTVAVVDLSRRAHCSAGKRCPIRWGVAGPSGRCGLPAEPASRSLIASPMGTFPEFDHGGSLVRSDVCVECRVHSLGAHTLDLRLHALRAGESGFVAGQTREQDGVDVVDIYSVAPDALAAAIAESVGLVGAGAHPRIAVAGGGSRLPKKTPETLEEFDDLGFPVRRAESDEMPAVSSTAARSW